MPAAVLTLNAGSSSLKFALFHADGNDILRGGVDGIGSTPRIGATSATGAHLEPPGVRGRSHEDALGPLLQWLDEHLDGDAIGAVGHRIVHGGDRFTDPVRIDANVLAALDDLVPLAPLHQPHNLAAIRAVAQHKPDLPQVGCFDTAFHRTMPAVATRLALPRSLGDAGLRRYGFHGLSYEFIAGRLRQLAPALAGGRVIVAHLGSGASLCAMVDGRSVETTMGFSTLDGLMMGTRPGNLDAGAVLYLLQSRGMAPDAVSDLLYHRAGLLGVSGLSGDMRKLAADETEPAREAIDLFAYRVAGEVGRLVSAMGGLDGLVFTAGIGEHDAVLRADIGRRLAWLGIRIDPAANGAAGPRLITETSASPEAWVLATDEEAVIARHTRRVLSDALG